MYIYIYIERGTYLQRLIKIPTRLIRTLKPYKIKIIYDSTYCLIERVHLSQAHPGYNKGMHGKKKLKKNSTEELYL